MSHGLPYRIKDGWYVCEDKSCHAETQTLKGMELHLAVCHGRRRASSLDRLPENIPVSVAPDLPRNRKSATDEHR